MDPVAFITVEQAACRLGISSRAVTSLAVSGKIDGLKHGNTWLLDARSVERRGRQNASPGRPLSPHLAWAVLLLASDEPAADLVAWQPHHLSRARHWLQGHPLSEFADQLRSRADSECFHGHPSELSRLLDRDDVLRTGVSAAETVRLHGGPPQVEFYAPASHRSRIVADHALEAGSGPIQARWVSEKLWPALADRGDAAPRAAVLVDLLENDDPRARREAARCLSQ